MDASSDAKEDTQDSIYVLLIGSSGKGKSSHARLLTGNENIGVAKRDDTKSCTTSTSVYECKSDSRYKIIDTQGAEDSENVENDATILRKAQQELYSLHADKIVILWFVDKNNKSTPALQAQAAYISKFGDKIWKSVHIIVKEPGNAPRALKEAAQGALESAAKFGAGDGLTWEGYHCIEWCDQEDQDWINGLDDIMKRKMNYLSEKEITEATLKVIQRLPPCEIFFRNRQCVKCGIVGDKRFTDEAKCHSNGSKYHECKIEHVHDGHVKGKHEKKKSMVAYHEMEDEKSVHVMEMEQYHPIAEPITFHPQQSIIKKHSGGIVDNGKWEKKDTKNKEKREFCPMCRKDNYLKSLVVTTEHFAGMFQQKCYKCGKILRKHESFKKCCKCDEYICAGCLVRFNGSAKGHYCNAKSCGENYTREYTWRGIFGTKCDLTNCRREIRDGDTYYGCFNCASNGYTSKRCTECVYYKAGEDVWVSKSEWSCCKRGVSGQPCADFCTLCQKFVENDKGCQFEYKCCKQGKESKGCVYLYKCCGRDDQYSANGCSYQCCERRIGSNGCKQKEEDVFPCCNGNVPCVSYYSCCDKNLKSEGCKVMLGCKKGVFMSHDEYEMEKNAPEKGCAQRCGNVDCGAPCGKVVNGKVVGTTPGCLEMQKHEWIDLK